MNKESSKTLNVMRSLTEITTQDFNCSYYLKKVCIQAERRDLIPKFADFILSKVNSSLTFDTIVFRGMSGALIAPSIADLFGVPFLMVRKLNDDRHSSKIVEGHVNTKQFIIIDDLMASGSTILKILNQVSSIKPDAKCSGIFLYAGENSAEFSFKENIPVFTLDGDC